MRRSIKEIYNIILRERRLSELALKTTIEHDKIENVSHPFVKGHIYGEIDTYTYILNLLETSGVVEDEIIR